MVRHLFNRCARLDLARERQELVVVRHEGESLLHGIERAGTVAEMRAELAELQVRPRIVRLLLCALFNRAECVIEAAAVHERDGIAVVPCAAAARVHLRGRHPLHRAVIVFVVVQIVARVRVPEGNIEIGVRFLARKIPLDHAVLDVRLQIVQHYKRANSFGKFLI